MKKYYTEKSGKTLARQKRMTKKLGSTEAHMIVKDYVKIQAKNHKGFQNIKELVEARKIGRNTPSKLLARFCDLWKEFYPGKEVDYKVNVFLMRSHLRKHRSLPENKEYESYVKQYSRGGYQTYCAECESKDKPPELKKGMFYYYKDGMRQKTKSTKPKKKAMKGRLTAKERYSELYKIYDFIIRLIAFFVVVNDCDFLREDVFGYDT